MASASSALLTLDVGPKRELGEEVMLQIMLVIVGVFYLVRRSKIKALSPAQFPNVPLAVVMERQALELKGAHRFLWASAGQPKHRSQ